MTTAGAARPGWARTAATSLVVGLATSGSIFAGMVALAPAASAADDSSAVTVTAAEQDPDLATAPFPDLSVTVSQTRSLQSQGITLEFSGGKRSTMPNNQIAGANFLQIIQCWGDLKDPSTGELIRDENGQPQPDRTTCQYGSTGAAGQSRTTNLESDDYIAPEDAAYAKKANGYFDPAQVAFPFRSVTGKTLERIVGGAVVANPPDLDNNEFFTKNTTNEVAWAGFDSAGTGRATFEVQTAQQSYGLGCGNPVTASDGTVSGQPCWLVIIPRGDHDLGSAYVNQSALLWSSWKHRLAVRLEFRPLGVRCALGAAERQLAGSELIAGAISSWQPELCSGSGGSVFSLIIGNEADAARTADGTGQAPLALTTRALSDSDSDASDDLVYAPVALTGLAIAFSIDHQSDSLRAVPEEVAARDRQPFSQLKLTPRLLAKLLTNSYTDSLPTSANLSYLGSNPRNITYDPDFLAINDSDWAYQSLAAPSLGDLLVPLGRSDSAWTIWSYILADADARAFLAGERDPWGMVVNPWASTSRTVNATVNPPDGVAAEYPTDSFPKADPVEARHEELDKTGLASINLVTWRPYAPDLDTAGYWVLRGDGRVVGGWDPLSVPPKYSSAGRDALGQQKVLGLTSTASAARYQVYVAALRNPAGQFVTPTTSSMLAASDAMSTDADQPQVVGFDATSSVAASAKDAYPLTMPVYAATNPAGGDAASRTAYASFIRYAVSAGQTSGTDVGELPPGYAPLPPTWRAQALKAAAAISAGPTSSSTPTPTASETQLATIPPAAVEPPSSVPPAGTLPATGDTPSTEPSQTPAAPVPSPSESATGVAVGSATPADSSTGVLSAAVPISAAGGLVAAACVPLVGRPRRAP